MSHLIRLMGFLPEKDASQMFLDASQMSSRGTPGRRIKISFNGFVQ
jgi:hypothetical protein